MKSFRQFITEAETYDREGLGHGTGMTHRGGEKIGRERKKDRGDVPSPHSKGKAKPRVKAIGGGKTEPVSYKKRSDIGKQRPQGRASERQQQPTKDKHTQQLTPKERQRKAYLERKAKEKGAKTQTASQLLSKRKEGEVEVGRARKVMQKDPNYKPPKASGLTPQERKAVTRKGERTLRDITLASTGKEKESELKHPITQKEITRRNKKKR